MSGRADQGMMEDSPLFSPEQLCDQLTVGFIAVDRAGIVQAVNSAVERLLGKPRRHLIGASLEELLPGHPVALDLIERSHNLGMPCRVRNAQLSAKPGSSNLVSMTAAPILDAQGQPTGAILQLEEVGTVSRLEEGQRLHDTLNSLGEMALAVAHEVKNPLAGIRGAAQLLELEAQSDSATDCTRLIRTEVDRISRLLDNLLGMADVRTLDAREINIHLVLDHVLKLCQGQHPQPVQDYDPSLPAIRGDRDQLIQLFLNLLKNAQEAAGEGGAVRVRTRISNQVRLEQGRRIPHVLVEMVDNGPGIPQELRQRIFHPFVSTKSKGTGLGLAIAQRIVHDHSGLVEVTSHPGETIFRIYLPVPR
ncbi:MAG: PAS domain-containing protein [Magnetococcales bacterium]|nr:PAS domain-containing protein [Magnetococcales bacterium]